MGSIYKRRPLRKSTDTEGYNKTVFRQKREWRRREARLPIEEKMRILLDLQHIAYEIGRSQGRTPSRPWR